MWNIVIWSTALGDSWCKTLEDSWCETLKDSWCKTLEDSWCETLWVDVKHWKIVDVNIVR